MKEEIISFKTAKLAEEKGFSMNTLYFWESHEAKPLRLVECTSGTHPNYYHHRDCYMAPTQSLLQKWLRETHDLHCIVEPLEEPDTYHCRFYNGRTNIYSTYEEALEAGLFESLKLVK